MSRFVLTLSALALALALAPPLPAPAQTVRVRLDLTGADRGPVHQRFAASLRALDDTEVVDAPALADYGVAVSVLCVPEPDACEAAESFSATVVLSEPLTAGVLREGLRRTGDGTLSDWSATDEARHYLQRYRQIHAIWTTSWGPDRVAAGVDDLVAGIDARCFEKRRIVERRAALEGGGDPEVARALASERYAGQEWLC